jgi:hypothetical protein
MAISRVVSVRVLPKRLDDFITRLGEAKKILERNGARVTFFRTLAGPDPNAVLIVSTVEDWPQFAQVAAKVESDAAWQAFERQLVDDPVAERLSSGMIQDFTLP